VIGGALFESVIRFAAKLAVEVFKGLAIELGKVAARKVIASLRKTDDQK